MPVSKDALIKLQIRKVKKQTVDMMAENILELDSMVNDESIATSAILGGILAATMDAYKQHLGPKDAAMMFYHVADDLATKTDNQIKFPKNKRKD